jgi:hypothetical protein
MSLIIKKNTTFKIPRTGLFLPSSLGGLALWLKADAGVSTLFLNQITLTGAEVTTSNGTYTRTNGATTQFDGPNGNFIEFVEQDGTNDGFVVYDQTIGDYTYNITIDRNTQQIISISERGFGAVPSSSTTTSNGGTIINSWTDQSINGTIVRPNFQMSPTFSSSFINGKPAIEFIVGSNTGLSNPSFGLTGFTFFSVAKQKSTNGGRIFSSYYGNVLIGTWGNLSNRFYGGNENGWLYEGTQESTDFLITTAFSDADTSFGFYQNGILQSNGNSNSTVILNGISVGGGIWNGGNEEASDSYVCEIVIYNRTLSLTERQQVEAYLNQKYQIY